MTDQVDRPNRLQRVVVGDAYRSTVTAGRTRAGHAEVDPGGESAERPGPAARRRGGPTWATAAITPPVSSPRCRRCRQVRRNGISAAARTANSRRSTPIQAPDVGGAGPGSGAKRRRWRCTRRCRTREGQRAVAEVVKMTWSVGAARGQVVDEVVEPGRALAGLDGWTAQRAGGSPDAGAGRGGGRAGRRWRGRAAAGRADDTSIEAAGRAVRDRAVRGTYRAPLEVVGRADTAFVGAGGLTHAEVPNHVDRMRSRIRVATVVPPRRRRDAEVEFGATGEDAVARRRLPPQVHSARPCRGPATARPARPGRPGGGLPPGETVTPRWRRRRLQPR